MAITSALVLYAVIWFIVFFVLLPVRLTTQIEAGQVVPGTHASAPQSHGLKRKAWLAVLIALVIWAGVAFVIFSGRITVEMLDVFGLGAEYRRGL